MVLAGGPLRPFVKVRGQQDEGGVSRRTVNADRSPTVVSGRGCAARHGATVADRDASSPPRSLLSVAWIGCAHPYPISLSGLRHGTLTPQRRTMSQRRCVS